MLKKFLFIILATMLFSNDNIDITKLAKTASKQNKILFVWLHTTDCGYCESMREFTLDDERVKELLKKKFLFTHINVKENGSVVYKNFKGSKKDFATFIGYDLYPSSLFFDENANLIFATIGYKEEKDFYIILEYIASKEYKTKTLKEYIKSKK